MNDKFLSVLMSCLCVCVCVCVLCVCVSRHNVTWVTQEAIHVLAAAKEGPTYPQALQQHH